MKHLLDLENWDRKDHFNFFKNFDEPFFGITVEIDCTKAYDFCKRNDTSFFLYYLHKSLVAANKIEAFRYRISEDQIFVFDQINASPTINRANGTFGFSYMDYFADFSTFEDNAKTAIEKVQNSTGLIPSISGENVIHYSSIPWINFTSLSHARNFSFKDSCPKISFGKMSVSNSKRTMPVSIHVHHGLMDGFHVSQFIDMFQELMNEQ
jgi:chloramphenicol O-acetyltransferase type A